MPNIPLSETLLKELPLEPELKEKIRQEGIYMEFEKGSEVLKAGQYVKVIPIVVDGLLKVYSKYHTKELLLYYIQPHQSCIMSFSAGLQNGQSRIFASAEEDCKMILLPVDKVNQWIREYPSLNELFFTQYSLRYDELVTSMSQLLFETLDKKVHHYLKQKMEVTGRDFLKLKHKEIANDLGTSREVISRVLKKLEEQALISQFSDGIQVL